MLACPPYQGETSATIWGVGSRHVTPSPPEHRVMGRIWPCPPPRDRTRRRTRCQSYGKDERGANSHTPIRAERSTPNSQALLPGRNKTIRPRDRVRSRTLQDRPLNMKTLGNRPTPLTVPHPTADHPEHAIKRGNHDSQTSPEKNDARVDDEPFHHEAHRATASTTTTREPIPRAHATRIVERARKRDTVAETHFQSNLSDRMG